MLGSMCCFVIVVSFGFVLGSNMVKLFGDGFVFVVSVLGYS